MKGITDTTQFVRNHDWKKNQIIDPIGTPPDRFAPLSGNNNYRSGKIASFEQLKMLKKKYGIKRVVNLALDSMKHQQDPNFNCGGMEAPCEPLWAEKLGLEYFPAYLSSRPPAPDKWEVIKAMLAKGNTLIHCTHGVDRTGAVAGAWRKTIEPEVTNDTILPYTYAFGGQWRMADDPNRYLRDFILKAQYDPAVRSAVDRSLRLNLPLIFGGLAFLGLSGAIYYRFFR